MMMHPDISSRCTIGEEEQGKKIGVALETCAGLSLTASTRYSGRPPGTVSDPHRAGAGLQLVHTHTMSHFLPHSMVLRSQPAGNGLGGKSKLTFGHPTSQRLSIELSRGALSTRAYGSFVRMHWKALLPLVI